MSDTYDFTTLGITPGPWSMDARAGHALTERLVITAPSADRIAVISNNGGAESPEANANLIAAAPDFLRYAMWEEEMAYINAQSNEGLDAKLANLEIIVLACKYFPDISELLSSMDEDEDEEEEAEKFWAAISKASLKLRQDALASVGLPALVDTDGESLIVRENGGAA